MQSWQGKRGRQAQPSLTGKILPAVFTLLLVLLITFPAMQPLWRGAAPNLALASVFFWMISWPRVMPLWLCTVFGLILDVGLNTPLGTFALVLLLLAFVTLRQRRFLASKPFGVLWFCFAMGVCAIHGSLWLGFWLAATPLPSATFAMHTVFTIIFFPLVYGICVGIERLAQRQTS